MSNKSSKMLDDDLLDQVAASAPLEVKKETSAVQRQVVIYDVPKEHIAAVKRIGAKMSSYMRIALQEKLERDGHI
jgi:hypothetical protein